MSLTIDTEGVDWDLAAHLPTEPTLGEESPVERWLFRMGGIRAGKSSPIVARRTNYLYPPAVAGWLHTMWGV